MYSTKLVGIYRKLEMYDMQAWVLNKMLYSEKTIFRIFY